LNKINNLSEEISYTKYIPSQYYEYDTRGYVTINIPFNGKIVATIKYSNTENTNLQEISFVHNSYNATPVLITDGNASTTAQIKSDAWGTQIQNQVNINTQIKTSFGLTGHKWDENSALTYSHARYLNNNSKIWLSNDPMSITGFSSDYFVINPQYQNSYSYVANNPVNNIDPDGRATWEFVTGQQNWPDYREESRVYLQNEVDQGTFIGNAFRYPGLYGATAGGMVFAGGVTAIGAAVAKSTAISVGVVTTMRAGYDIATQSTPDLGKYVNTAKDAGVVGGAYRIGAKKDSRFSTLAGG
jgi:RHS repeat-associated protein